MTPTWRILDTGLRSASENIALNLALLQARQEPAAHSTLRFLQFTPSALLGFHQSAEQALNLDYCHNENIAIQRRITGGGAIYFDAGQLGWELYLHKRDVHNAPMQTITEHICTAAAQGMRALGVEAQFRPRNDIEVGGKKIAGTGGAFDGDVLLYQGSLLLEFDVEKMLKVLRIPTEKLADKAIASARERVTSLREQLGYTPALDVVKTELSAAFARHFSVNFQSAGLSDDEQARLRHALQKVSCPSWVNQQQRPRSELPLLEAQQKFSGGLVHVALAYDARGDLIKQVWFSGDFFVSPRRAIPDLEASLRDTLVAELPTKLARFFAHYQFDGLGLSSQDFLALMHSALSNHTVGA